MIPRIFITIITLLVFTTFVAANHPPPPPLTLTFTHCTPSQRASLTSELHAIKHLSSALAQNWDHPTLSPPIRAAYEYFYTAGDAAPLYAYESSEVRRGLRRVLERLGGLQLEVGGVGGGKGNGKGGGGGDGKGKHGEGVRIVCGPRRRGDCGGGEIEGVEAFVGGGAVVRVPRGMVEEMGVGERVGDLGSGGRGGGKKRRWDTGQEVLAGGNSHHHDIDVEATRTGVIGKRKNGEEKERVEGKVNSHREKVWVSTNGNDVYLVSCCLYPVKNINTPHQIPALTYPPAHSAPSSGKTTPSRPPSPTPSPNSARFPSAISSITDVSPPPPCRLPQFPPPSPQLILILTPPPRKTTQS